MSPCVLDLNLNSPLSERTESGASVLYNTKAHVVPLVEEVFSHARAVTSPVHLGRLTLPRHLLPTIIACEIDLVKWDAKEISVPLRLAHTQDGDQALDAAVFGRRIRPGPLLIQKESVVMGDGWVKAGILSLSVVRDKGCRG